MLGYLHHPSLKMPFLFQYKHNYSINFFIHFLNLSLINFHTFSALRDMISPKFNNIITSIIPSSSTKSSKHGIKVHLDNNTNSQYVIHFLGVFLEYSVPKMGRK